jgi:hypothetical protein
MQEISGLARSIYNYTLDSMQRLGAQTTDDDSPILLLGKEYTSLSSQEFLDDWQTRPWITYRSGFPPINPSEYTSDAGWGCMLRSGQMLLANTSFLHHFGRDFRVGDKNTNQQYSKVDRDLILTPRSCLYFLTIIQLNIPFIESRYRFDSILTPTFDTIGNRIGYQDWRLVWSVHHLSGPFDTFLSRRNRI